MSGNISNGGSGDERRQMNEVKIKEPDNSPMKIGLDEQGHLPTIKRMREKGSTWSEIAREIGWEEIPLRAHWQLHTGDPETRHVRFALALAVATVEHLDRHHGYHFNGMDSHWVWEAKWFAEQVLKENE